MQNNNNHQSDQQPAKTNEESLLKHIRNRKTARNSVRQFMIRVVKEHSEDKGITENTLNRFTTVMVTV